MRGTWQAPRLTAHSSSVRAAHRRPAAPAPARPPPHPGAIGLASALIPTGPSAGRLVL